MNKYMFSYYLEENNQEQYRNSIHKYMESMDNWCNFIPSSCLFKTNKPLQQIKVELSQLIGSGNTFIVCEITENFVSQFNGKQSKWIEENFI